MSFKISTRLYMMGALALVMMTLGTLFSVINTQNRLVEERKNMLIALVDSASSIAQEYERRELEGEMTRAQAQDAAITAIGAIRYAGTEYFWINDMEPVMVMHPLRPERVGQNVGDMADANGKPTYANFVRTVRESGAGFVDYDQLKPGFEDPQPKISYVKGTSWGWVVGTGVYVDDLDAMFWNNAMMLGFALLGGFAVMGGSAFIITRSITRPVNALTGVMGELAQGHHQIDIPATKAKDEVGDMARAVMVFKQAAIDKLDIEAQAEQARKQRETERFATEQERAAAQAEKEREAEADAFAVEAVANGLAALASGELTYRIKADLPEKAQRLKTDFNATADKLADVVTQLRQTSRALKVATGEILAGTNDLSERTTKQAAAIEETSAAMDQLTTTVNENAQKAENAFAGSETAAKLANEGGTVMADATTAMERITTSSSKISNIIGMIDDIAFQTNLLALNASVEAARAGEAGKGFAVVAVEVRRLAQSAAEASSEVKALIEQSANEVDGGSKLVANAAQKLAAILQSVEENSALMKDISRANREQTSAINEVSTAIRQMDEMTQHNAALVEETNAAIEQTEAQASELDRIVDVFKVSGASEAEPVRQPAPANSSKPSAPAKTRTAASAYLSQGNAALKAEEWDEF
ncbi:methyl-accepting chemotaxis protein [Pelagibacterium lentulum]|uniref:methyl-accepting chemotaxis protein n=1 Tax=Pelagibacterium lentulum TaxID=2029865 RepID=UPI000F8F0589|nr:methyl-accepting chemotaxis protein [Pelagibacterium lentulum]